MGCTVTSLWRPGGDEKGKALIIKRLKNKTNVDFFLAKKRTFIKN